MRQSHPEETKIFKCSKCEKVFDVWKNFKRHEVMVHADKRSFICNIESCGKRFKRNPSLQRHLEIHSTKKDVCSLCGLQFSSSTTLRRHMIVHSDTKDYACNFPSCDLKFKRSKALKIHLIQHSGLRPCELKFQDPRSVNMIMTIKCLLTGQCPWCPNKSFSSGTNLRGHKKKLHSVELAEMEASGRAPPTVRMPNLKELQLMNRK